MFNKIEIHFSSFKYSMFLGGIEMMEQTHKTVRVTTGAERGIGFAIAEA